MHKLGPVVLDLSPYVVSCACNELTLPLSPQVYSLEWLGATGRGFDNTPTRGGGQGRPCVHEQDRSGGGGGLEIHAPCVRQDHDCALHH
jgi:hypothetical protein